LRCRERRTSEFAASRLRRWKGSFEMTEDNKKQAELPETSPGLEPPIKESSEQRGMAPRPDEKEKLVPIGKSGLSAGKPDR